MGMQSTVVRLWSSPDPHNPIISITIFAYYHSQASQGFDTTYNWYLILPCGRSPLSCLQTTSILDRLSFEWQGLKWGNSENMIKLNDQKPSMTNVSINFGWIEQIISNLRGCANILQNSMPHLTIVAIDNFQLILVYFFFIFVICSGVVEQNTYY